jgi:hypothetical protein
VSITVGAVTTAHVGRIPAHIEGIAAGITVTAMMTMTYAVMIACRMLTAAVSGVCSADVPGDKAPGYVAKTDACRNYVEFS